MTNENQHDSSLASLFSEEINEDLKQRFGYKRRCADFDPTGDTIHAKAKKMDIYLRFPENFRRWHEMSGILVVARIGFAEQRKGHGTWLLELLSRLAPKYGYKSIAIESTNHKESIQNFVRKFGFEAFPEGDTSQSNWIISINDLNAELLLLEEKASIPSA